MKWSQTQPDRLISVRPVVRYVDEDQAVIDVQFGLLPPLPTQVNNKPAPDFEALVEINNSEGFHDEQRIALKLNDYKGMVRFDLVQPQRWWPAGMGNQPLYDLKITLLHQDQVVAQHAATIGLTSVRRVALDNQFELLVNGQVCEIQSIVPVDLADERSLLPAAGDSLLVIRGHYGPDLLYNAADRAGILLIQCVPIHPNAEPDQEMLEQVDRLAPHPSLAGWFVGHLGKLSDKVGRCIRTLDPGHSVFSDVPGLSTI